MRRERTTVTEVGELDAVQRADIATWLAHVEERDGHPALPDPQHRALLGLDDSPAGLRIVLSQRDTGISGLALVSPARDGSVVLHLVLGPSGGTTGPTAQATTLTRRALALVPPRAAAHLWVMQAGPDDDARAAALGFRPERDVVQLRIPLPLPTDVVTATRPLSTRAFVPGRDEVAWLATNNSAFATHPEQGGWTEAQLHERLAADWVDLEGFLVADDPDGPGLLGFCWTKVHHELVPPLGEIYVIAVDPRHHGRGWGRSLTVAGLESLAGRGLRHGMLYTEGDNRAAIGLYRALGFVVDHTDRSYRRDPLVPG